MTTCQCCGAAEATSSDRGWDLCRWCTEALCDPGREPFCAVLHDPDATPAELGPTVEMEDRSLTTWRCRRPGKTPADQARTARPPWADEHGPEPEDC